MKPCIDQHYGKTSPIGAPLYDDEEVIIEKFTLNQGDPMGGGPCMSYFLRTKREENFFTYHHSGTLEFSAMLYLIVNGTSDPLDEESAWCKHLVEHYACNK